jgi:hypothetical protein
MTSVLSMAPTLGTSKAGGDVAQINTGSQDNASGKSQMAVANAGPVIMDSIGGVTLLAQVGEQVIGQVLGGANLGSAVNGGSDNAHSDTNVIH